MTTHRSAKHPASRAPGIARGLGAVSAIFLAGAAALTVTAGPAAAHDDTSSPKAEVNFAGTVALSNCSGSVVRMPDSQDSDPALVMTNGHCLESGMPDAGKVIVDEPNDRTFDLLDADAKSAGTLTASKIAYATMTDTDVTLYELTNTYAEITEKYSIDALEVADTHAKAGTAITVVSGYWKDTYSCDIDDFVYELHEGDYVWKDSTRYAPGCDTIGGTSGSPVVDQSTGKVVAVNNTGNEDGEECTMNNPCEVDKDGKTTAKKGTNYAQNSYQIPGCVDKGNKVNLDKDGCKLPKP